MISNEKVSIIMAVYNESNTMIEKSVESILNQSFREFEFIIVLDNPENIRIKELLLKYANRDSRIVLIENCRNIGLASSLNKGIKMSRYNLIARMDADDISDKYRLEEQVNYLNNNIDIDIIGTKMRFIDEEGKPIERDNKIVASNEMISKLLPFGNQLNHPTWMFRKEVLKDLEGYRNFPSSQDYDFLLRANFFGYKFANIEKNLLSYRIRINSISLSKRIYQLKMVLYIQKLYRERLKTGKDSFAESYVKKINSKKFRLFRKANVMYNQAILLFGEKKYLLSALILFVSLAISKDQVQLFFNDLRIKKVWDDRLNL